jgi:hypothetical protein
MSTCYRAEPSAFLSSICKLTNLYKLLGSPFVKFIPHSRGKHGANLASGILRARNCVSAQCFGRAGKPQFLGRLLRFVDDRGQGRARRNRSPLLGDLRAPGDRTRTNLADDFGQAKKQSRPALRIVVRPGGQPETGRAEEAVRIGKGSSSGGFR